MRHRNPWTWTIALGAALLGSTGRPPDAPAQAPPARPQAAAITLHDGDRVVLVGGTLIEREAESCYLETQLARRYPGQRITVRNLGWSGDTVLGESRAVGNPVQDGFRQLVDHVVALKPTVIVLGYGANEAFAGAGGLPQFAGNLARLWDALAPTGARFVVLLPPRQANLGPPLPDPSLHNADLQLYGAAIRIEAERRGAVVVDLFDLIPEQRIDPDKILPVGRNGIRLGDLVPPRPDDEEGDGDLGPLTTNGLHLNAMGYWRLADRVAPSLAGPLAAPVAVVATVDAASATALPAAGLRVDEVARTGAGVRFRIGVDRLPDSPSPPRTDGRWMMVLSAKLVRVTGLAPGKYALKVDGQTPTIFATATADPTADAWALGVPIVASAESDQAETLRKRIIAKNLMYFHRWRPQNETYLFGFRKYEQGRNAAELAAFDPLIAAEEAEIARLSRPVPHVYELTRVGDAGPAPAPAPRTGEAPR